MNFDRFDRALRCGVVALLISTAGCQTYQEKNHVIVHWERSRLPQAEREATERATKESGSKDAIIWRLEQGAVLRAAGKYAESNQAFDQAEAAIDRYEEAAKVRLSREAAALLSNQASVPYEGRAYDKVMLNTYKALNYLALGDYDKARTELFRAYQRQQDAVDLNARRIEREQAALRPEAARVRQDPSLNAQLRNVYASLNSMRGYADYVNPFAVWLDGLFFLCQAADTSDLERARKSFERVLSMIGENRFVRADLQMADQVLAGQPIPPTTYVVLEAGLAPQRGQVRIDLPLFIPEVPYVGAAFPTLEFNPNTIQSVRAQAGGQSEQAVLLASMDRIIAQDFRNEQPAIVARTIASSVAKAVGTYGLQEGLGQLGRNRRDHYGETEAALRAVGALVGSVFQFAVNIADTRTWTTLPKEFQIARFPTPADRRVELASMGGTHKTVVTIADGLVNVVYVKSITPSGPLIVTQLKLK